MLPHFVRREKAYNVPGGSRIAPERSSFSRPTAQAEGNAMANCACPSEHARVAIDGYDPAARVKALEQLLVEKGYVDPAALDVIVETYAHEVGPMNGAKVVAKAWSDPDFRARLLADGTAGAAELGFGGRGGEHIVVVENTPRLHNLIVCTLCSCYP